MKYGKIICDPDSEEAKNLVGKKVVCGWYYAPLKKHPEQYIQHTLSYIQDSCKPFVCGDEAFYFIREVIEDEPTYRPYKDTDEMIADFCQRFGIVKNACSMPVIFLKTKYGWKNLVSDYGAYSIKVDKTLVTLNELFAGYTYLDGSPVGKEVDE